MKKKGIEINDKLFDNMRKLNPGFKGSMPEELKKANGKYLLEEKKRNEQKNNISIDKKLLKESVGFEKIEIDEKQVSTDVDYTDTTIEGAGINEEEASSGSETLDAWKQLMDKYDLQYYKEFQTLSNSDLEQMREDWKAMRRFALSKLNQELNNAGKGGQLLNMDVADDQLYPYLDDNNKFKFFKYSRILDFKDGYKPKNIVLVKKGLENKREKKEREAKEREEFLRKNRNGVFGSIH